MEATVSRRSVKEDIKVQPWLPVCIDGKQYMMKSFFSSCETSYKIIIYESDNMKMWSEDVDVEKFGLKWKENNPNIEASYANLLSYVKSSLEESRVASTLKLISESETIVNLIVKMKLKGKIPFNWKFKCSKCDLMLIKQVLIDPLFNVVEELNRQQKKLIKTINDKDKEIEDYKDQGYTTTRSHLLTLPFQESSFQTRCMIDEEFIANSQRTSVEALTNPNVTQLLRNIMLNKQAIENKTTTVKLNTSVDPTFDTVGSHSVDKLVNVASWSGAGRHPESLLHDKIDIECNSIIETQSSPFKSPVDEEKTRREKLRQRLEEDEKKNKNKKRKINL